MKQIRYYEIILLGLLLTVQMVSSFTTSTSTRTGTASAKVYNKKYLSLIIYRNRHYQSQPESQYPIDRILITNKLHHESLLLQPLYMTTAASSSSSSVDADDNNGKNDSVSSSSSSSSSSKRFNNSTNGIIQQVKEFITRYIQFGGSASSSGGDAATSSTKLTTKERLAKVGIAAALSYGWVSNVSYAICVSIAWFIFTKRTGLSPLASGQWKGFLATYFGFYVFNNIIRPARLALAVAIAPFLDTVIGKVQKRLNVNKGIAIAITVFTLNVIGTCSLMSGGILIASCLTGVPIFPSK